MALDVFQQVYSLSLASNRVNHFEGTQTSLQKILQVSLQDKLLPLLPGWQLVWGPVVWKNEPDKATTGPDNSWYVAFHPNLQLEDGSVQSAYVIAVAGTPGKSEYAWTHEDFAVNSVTNFNAWVAGGIQNAPETASQIVPGIPYIAKGTVNAVHLLLTTSAPEGALSAGSTLLDFISNVDLSNVKIVVTGHSLGGALSPSLALTLVSAGVIPAGSTLTYPSAGPSPGNEGFANLFTATFPARKLASAESYQGWNLNLVNTLDIVPQAWSIRKNVSPKQNLFNIPSIYGTPVVPLVQGLIRLVAVFSLRSSVLYSPLPSQYFTGTAPSAVPTSLKEFLELALTQHVKNYISEVGIVVPDLVLGAGLREKTENEIRFNYPVIAGFEWAREHPKEVEKEIEWAEGSEEAKGLNDSAQGVEGVSPRARSWYKYALSLIVRESDV